MNKEYNIIIAGAGGIAQAVGLILAQRSHVCPNIHIGNRTILNAQKAADWINAGTTSKSNVDFFLLSDSKLTDEMKFIFSSADIILDCLPGSQAPRIAQFAKDFNCHYANLTEHVKETNQIIELVKDAKTGFVLQSGLAPGYIDILGNYLFDVFCKKYGVNRVDRLELKVGALTEHATPPHYYGFTWSPVGVATEYLEDTVVIRNHKKTYLPALSERSQIIIDGILYEQDLTSGGAADLPNSLAGKVAQLDYKTLRFPGHYAWVDKQINRESANPEKLKILQEKMEQNIPQIETDQVILYAAVEGKDNNGKLRRIEYANRVLQQYVGKHKLRAIQTTTAAPLVQVAQMLLESDSTGIILQSEIDPKPFLEGSFVNQVYGFVSF